MITYGVNVNRSVTVAANRDDGMQTKRGMETIRITFDAPRIKGVVIPLSVAIACAVALHLLFILFGGVLFSGYQEARGTLQQVDLLSETDIVDNKKEPEEVVKPEELQAEPEKPPEMVDIVQKMELSEAALAPELEAASLSSIEAALGGQHGSGDFAEALNFSSGGRIGGKGKAGGMNESLESAFSLSEIDQKPRVVFQAAPVYPSAMKGSEGVVTVLFVVDPTGKVINPRAERFSHEAFEKPAIDAVKQWKFEPAIKGGKRVACKMRVPIAFQPRGRS